MRRLATCLAVACLTALAFAPSLRAQTLQAGTWTGQVIPPEGQSLDATYEVTGAADSLRITLHADPHGSFPLSDIKVQKDKLSFTFAPGNNYLLCELKRQEDGGYKGECTDEDGVSGTLVMLPPSEKAEEDG